VTTDPRNIQQLGSTAIPDSEYVSFADDFLFLGGLRGGTEGIYKYCITNPASPVLIGRYVGRDPAWDDQFSCPIGEPARRSRRPACHQSVRRRPAGGA
jgi:hypothetical protein